MKKNIFIILLVVVISSCDAYLDEFPSKSTNLPLTTTEQLDAMLGNFDIYYLERNKNIIWGTDDWNLDIVFYNGDYGSVSSAVEVIQTATWDVTYTSYSGDAFWGKEYNKIFHANMVLDYIDKVEGNKEEKARLKSEAHLIKAYSYWVLANTYCLPYNENNNSKLGLTIKNSVSFEENFERASLKKTYKEIEFNIEEALKSKNTLFEGGKFRPWRGNISAARAFAARYYLGINNYVKALDYANKALSDYSKLVDYNTEMFYDTDTITVNEKKVGLDFPYTYRSSLAEMISYKEFYYSRFLYSEYAWFLPSERLLNMYDTEADLRYKYHIVDNYSLVRNSMVENIYPTCMYFGEYNIPSGPTTSEMILIKAECQARLGNWQDAMNTLEQLRLKRIDNNKYVKLLANSQEEAVKHIIKERRIERPFVFTWYDYRRFNNNEVSYDDVEIIREFYPYNSSSIFNEEELVVYELKKGDKRWARPIPNTEIESSEGRILQNEY